MDVLSTIKKEHREVGGLIDEVSGCEAGDERLMELAHEIENKLSLHLAIEERLFYARLRDGAKDKDDQVDVFEAYTEHEVAKQLMQMLKSGRKGDERFKAELQVLGESVKHHVKDEESKVFGVARELLSQEQLDEIGAAWGKAKTRALSQTASANGKRSGGRKTSSRTGSRTRKKTTRR